MNVITLKKGAGVPGSDQLETAELALDVSRGDLYTKLNDGSVVQLNDIPSDIPQAGIVVSATEPADPVDGMQWLNTVAVRLYFHDDGKWLEVPYSQYAGSGDGGDSKPEGYEETKADAFGAMSVGDMVVLNDDGTVSAVAGAIIPGAEVEGSLGSPQKFHAGTTVYLHGTYDAQAQKSLLFYSVSSVGSYAQTATVSGDSVSFGNQAKWGVSTTFAGSSYDDNAKKHIIAYRDNGDNGYGKALVATVSGDTVSFGSATKFSSATTNYSTFSYDSVAKKHLLICTGIVDGSNGNAMVATISGTSVSFGTPKSFSTKTSNMDCAYHAASGKHIVCYRDRNKGNAGEAFTAEISGTNVTFGSESNFCANIDTVGAAYDVSSGKTVVAYTDVDNGRYGTARVAVADGSGVTFYTPVVFNSADSRSLSITADTSNGKIIIQTKDKQVHAGTVEGDTIVFGEPLSLEGSGTYNECIHDPSSQKTLICYGDDAQSEHGYVQLYSPEISNLPDTIETNLTDSNYIGVSTGDYDDGAEATVQIAGINNDQQGMTLGKQYIQFDGALDTTAGDPSVEAGTAISSTELNIKDTV